MTKERALEIINNLTEWAMEHDDEFIDCFVDAMGLTNEESDELGWTDYYYERECEEEEEK